MDEQARAVALHQERLRALHDAAAGLGPDDPPRTDPAMLAAEPAEPLPAPAAAEEAAGSVELVEAALRRIEALDGRLGAFVAVLADQARAEAAERDAERAAGRVRGPLHGLPVAVKDLLDVAGTVTGAGSPKLAGNRVRRDAAAVARLRAAGAVVVGKTRTHEFAYGVLTPGTANPWDQARIAGGSSGGSAAAVAAGMVGVAVGTDTAGSIRIPAACCGVVGFKPTHGAVPTAGVLPLAWSCDHVGPVAVDVAGATRLFQVLAARPGDAGGPPDRPRIGRLAADALGPVDPAVRAALDRLCERLAAAGAAIDEVRLPLAAARAAVAAIVLPEAAAVHARLLAETGEAGYGPAVLAALRLGEAAPAADYLEALRYRGRFLAEVEQLLAGRDALLLPTLPCVAPEAGRRTLTVDGVTAGVQAALTALPGAFNCSGSPVLSLPVDLVGGLPVAASLVGQVGGDAALLRLGAWVEAQVPSIGSPSFA
jgi:aspartyl-tRNA(Asn)/glutamyl-tRNA(Gln) amidotransferase subunit A